MRARSLLPLVPLLVLGCRNLLYRPVPIEADVTFAAHAAQSGIVVDRLPGGGGTLAPSGWWRWPGSASPTFVLTSANATVAGLWLTAPATVEVHAGDSRTTPPAGAVEPNWEDNAIRLTLRPAEGDALRTDLFARQATGGGLRTLSRAVQTVLDLRGVYRAVVRDAKGADVGWVRVKISPYQEAPHIYDGVLPAGVGRGLAAAVAVALDSEVQWIEDHTLDVYRGSGSGGPLQESIPVK